MMIRNDIPEDIRPARTTIRLTHRECIAALRLYVEGQTGERVPPGTLNVWGLATRNDHDDDTVIALVIDHATITQETE